MSYIDGFFDRNADTIRVVERKDGKRVFKEFPVRYTFYYEDGKGKYKSTTGKPLHRVVCKNTKDFHKELAINRNKTLFESDINPVYQCLSTNYINQDAPDLKIAFFDIESDFDPEKGFSLPSDPFMPITAISVSLQWMNSLVTLAVPPKGMSVTQAQNLVEGFENVFICKTEVDMLTQFLNLIEDVDVLSGWNSEGYDLPYIINRIKKVMSKDDTRRLCLWKQLPKKRTFERYGREQETYDLVGRVHVDSLELYRKYTYEERHSYRLDAIGEHEIGEKKTVYEGSLDQLYNQDFRKFIEYNRQDVALLDKLDKKLKFIDLTNELAHANTVLLQTTLGAVAVTEQAIINEAHRRGLQVPNRPKRDMAGTTTAAGAYVAFPKKGYHNWIGSMDLNSLYPSVIRALNMAPECVIGQLRPLDTDAMVEEQMTLQKKSFAGAWENRFGSIEYEYVMQQRRDAVVTIDWEDGTSESKSGAEVYKMIFDSNNPLILSANGTIFTSEFEGVIPGLLKRWYTERQDMQGMKKKAVKADNKAEEEFWDKRQLVKKINLNSLYGAILNPGCRFFDKRIGQSTTLTGRQIAKHMASKVNEVITGEYDHVGKAIIYGDTDSAYFSAYEVLKKEIDEGKIPWTKESVIKLYDQVCDEVNGTFKKFMSDAFHCPRSRSDVIQAGRESVAESGLFITKKRYAVLIYDLEGNRTDQGDTPGKVKAMGLDLKRSDTPPFVQDFLSELLLLVLTGKTEKEVLERIAVFRQEFKKLPGWQKASPKRANNIGEYGKKEERLGKANMPGHVRASINWNRLKKMNSDKHSMEIVDGMKVMVCKLKKNPLDYTSVAYPVDQLRIPLWFKELPFDDESMEKTLIDSKLGNLLGVLKWDISSTETKNTFNTLFDFGE
jgi:DNA polymerase elongation subunit (family B)|tara:strand:- start:1898 stop:4570 length:2673 start_codon:yes stop_codon:yes gene_type:complete